MSDSEIADALNNVAKAMNNCASSLHDIHQSIDSVALELGSLDKIAEEINHLGTFGDAKPE